jgi:hypothetical protein
MLQSSEQSLKMQRGITEKLIYKLRWNRKKNSRAEGVAQW